MKTVKKIAMPKNNFWLFIIIKYLVNVGVPEKHLDYSNNI
jgi:hypothetical protein